MRIDIQVRVKMILTLVHVQLFGKSSLLRINQRHHSLRTRLGTQHLFLWRVQFDTRVVYFMI